MADVTGSQISVPTDLGESGSQIMGIANNITQEIVDLQNKLAPLAEYWVGTASDGHQVTQANWNSAAQALMTDVGTLGQLASTMGANWNNYVDCQTTNTQSWAH